MYKEIKFDKIMENNTGILVVDINKNKLDKNFDEIGFFKTKNNDYKFGYPISKSTHDGKELIHFGCFDENINKNIHNACIKDVTWCNIYICQKVSTSYIGKSYVYINNNETKILTHVSYVIESYSTYARFLETCTSKYYDLLVDENKCLTDDVIYDIKYTNDRSIIDCKVPILFTNYKDIIKKLNENNYIDKNDIKQIKLTVKGIESNCALSFDTYAKMYTKQDIMNIFNTLNDSYQFEPLTMCYMLSILDINLK